MAQRHDKIPGIGIHGKVRSGKNHMCNVMKKHEPNAPLGELSFGECIKKATSALLTGSALSADMFNSQEDKDKPAEFVRNITLDQSVRAVLCVVAGIIFDFDEMDWRSEDPKLGGRTAGNVFDIIYKDIHSRLLKNGKRTEMRFRDPISRGRLLQIVGTDIFREQIHPDAWVLALRNRIEFYVRNNVFFVITDVRFPNEIDMVRGFGGDVVRIEAPEIDVSLRDPNHPSETACDGIELPTFVNDRSEVQNALLEKLCAYPWENMGERIAELPVRVSKFYKPPREDK